MLLNRVYFIFFTRVEEIKLGVRDINILKLHYLWSNWEKDGEQQEEEEKVLYPISWKGLTQLWNISFTKLEHKTSC